MIMDSTKKTMGERTKTNSLVGKTNLFNNMDEVYGNTFSYGMSFSKYLSLLLYIRFATYLNEVLIIEGLFERQHVVRRHQLEDENI